MTAQHWDEVFLTKDTHQVSWYQQNPEISLALIADTPGSVIDVGAGNSTLVDELLAAGRTELTVLDISEAALELTRRRLAHHAELVSFEVADITTWQPRQTYAVWHDRAVFHFLTNPADQSSYVNLVTHAISPGGALVVGTFAEDGPTQCSGLPTAATPSKAWPTGSQPASNSSSTSTNLTRPRPEPGNDSPGSSSVAVAVAVAVASPGDWDLDEAAGERAAMHPQLVEGYSQRAWSGSAG